VGEERGGGNAILKVIQERGHEPLSNGKSFSILAGGKKDQWEKDSLRKASLSSEEGITFEKRREKVPATNSLKRKREYLNRTLLPDRRFDQTARPISWREGVLEELTLPSTKKASAPFPKKRDIHRSDRDRKTGEKGQEKGGGGPKSGVRVTRRLDDRRFVKKKGEPKTISIRKKRKEIHAIFKGRMLWR